MICRITILAVILSSLTLHAQRSTDGLQALYTFTETGATVKDSSGKVPAIDLTIGKANAVRRGKGLLEVHGAAEIRSGAASARLTAAVQSSKEVTVEAWIRTASKDQSGPARIVSLSNDSTNRNVTLGQDGDRYVVRFRTTKTDGNGQPATETAAVTNELTHVVYTRNRDGNAVVYINGQQSATKRVPGELTNWNNTWKLMLGDERTGDRTWRGSYHLVAIYNRALKETEVDAHFKEGVDGTAAPAVAAVKPKPLPPPEKTTPPTPAAAAAEIGERVVHGLQVLYDFSSTDGAVVDRSGVGKPVNLTISDAKAIRRTAGALELTGKAAIRSTTAPAKLINSIKRSNALTLEAWLKPADTKQEGPARILTLSKNSTERNFTLGQEADRYDVRLRTTGTGDNGMPSLEGRNKNVKTALTHVVYTRSSNGTAALYINGKQTRKKPIAGNMSNWNGGFNLAIGNELSGDRQWRGTLYLAAIYSRALSPSDVLQNFNAGAGAAAPPAADGGSELFELAVAPILANHCLECHDAATAKGDLDLSTKLAAYKGGETGAAVAPGKLGDSLLWESVLDDAMPKKRDPLSKDQKAVLKRWIESGAKWTAKRIDPAVYLQDARVDQAWVQRLTVSEYIETVRQTFGVEIEAEARQILPPDLRADGFSNTAYNLKVDLKHISAYAKLSRVVADRLDVKAFAGRFSSKRLMTDKDMRGLIEKMGTWVLRGPVQDHELDLFRGISTTVAASGGDYDEAVRYVIEAMLQSPRFLYRMESQVGDGTAWPADDYEMASRMSYIIWGGPPDEALLKAADAGKLSSPADIEAAATRMLSDPRAERQALRFVWEWLNLGRLDNMRPDTKRFPKWRAKLGKDMQAETLAYFKQVAWTENRPLRDLMNAQVTFLTPELAAHYGLPQQDGGKYDLSKVPSRGGLLTHGSVLTMGGDDASMVTRGLFVLHDVLRGVIKSPPDNVDTTPIPSKPGQSHRAISEMRIKDKSCGGCHIKFEPLAFAFEKYDGLGTFMAQDRHGNSLREDGEILFPGDAKPIAFDKTAELLDTLAKNERVSETLTWKIAQFALGRPLAAPDRIEMAKVYEKMRKKNGTYRDVVTALVMSDLVRTTRTVVN
jgi:hypothetical protein